jgi:branched-chain amino acid transport system permease protein
MDASILRQLLIALAMITIMLMRPKGLWPSKPNKATGADK